MVRQKQKRQSIQTNEDCKSIQYDIGGKYNEKQNYNLTNVNTEEKFWLEACELHNNYTPMKSNMGSGME